MTQSIDWLVVQAAQDSFNAMMDKMQRDIFRSFSIPKSDYFSDALRYSMAGIAYQQIVHTDTVGEVTINVSCPDPDTYATAEELEKELDALDGNCKQSCNGPCCSPGPCDAECEKKCANGCNGTTGAYNECEQTDIEFKPCQDENKTVDTECHCTQLLKGHERGCRYYKE